MLLTFGAVAYVLLWNATLSPITPALGATLSYGVSRVIPKNRANVRTWFRRAVAAFVFQIGMIGLNRLLSLPESYEQSSLYPVGSLLALAGFLLGVLAFFSGYWENRFWNQEEEAIRTMSNRTKRESPGQ